MSDTAHLTRFIRHFLSFEGQFRSILSVLLILMPSLAFGAVDKVGVYRPSQRVFYLDADGNNAWNMSGDESFRFGAPDDVPIAGDWDGDGFTEIGVYRPQHGVFYLDLDGDNIYNASIDRSFRFGAPYDIPIAGDWNGDGIDQVGVYRPQQGVFYLDYDGDKAWDASIDRAIRFGAINDIPVIGDWNGDAVDEIGVFRRGAFYLDLNGNKRWDGSSEDHVFKFGSDNDLPISGDWNGDAIDDIGIYRSREKSFYLDTNGDHAWNATMDNRFRFGKLNDLPIAGNWYSATHSENTPPTITGDPATSVSAGTTYLFTPSAQDADGDTLTFTIADGPSWASFDQDTGVLQGTPSDTDVGTTSGIQISVSDGAETVSLAAFDITVTGSTSGGPITISNTIVTSGKNYVWGNLREGGKVYTDRSYTYSVIPSAYLDFDVLQTANDDKRFTDDDFLRFDVDQPVTVYVAFDTQIPTLPNWLQSWTDTNDEIVDITTRRIYKKDFAAGTVTLGGNEYGYSMYTVMIDSHGGGSSGGGDTGSATLTWTCPTTNADGTPLDDLAGFRIYKGTALGAYTNPIQVNDPNVCDQNNVATYEVDDLAPATYFFEVTAFDWSGNESESSNVATKTIVIE